MTDETPPLEPSLLRRIPAPIRSVARLPRGRRIAIVKGQDKGRFLDFYHDILTIPWPLFFLRLGVMFVIVNLAFATLYMLDRGGIANARPGSFADAFFFSVQTLGTLGYGVMAPKTLFANLLVTVESFSGILTIALFTGIIFARFSRPFARVVFSKVAVVTPYDTVPTLMFRTANQRGDAIMDASVTATLTRRHTSVEGITMLRFHDLKLVRSSSALFAMSWTVMHPIDADSPLFGLTQQEMLDRDMEIVITLSGLDEILHDRIYVRHGYWADEILWNHRFVDVVSVAPSGQRMLDLTRFHDTMECPAAPETVSAAG